MKSTPSSPPDSDVLVSGRRFVVLDRDGTVIVERHYLSDPEQVELIPNAAAALQTLRNMDLGLVVVTNQSGVGRGYYSEEMVGAVNQRMVSLLDAAGVRLDGVYWCPHSPDDRCACRKPETGMITQATTELGLEPNTCFVVGDNRTDIELGQRIGATTLLVRTGHGAETADDSSLKPDYVTEDLAEATSIIQQIITNERTRTPSN